MRPMISGDVEVLRGEDGGHARGPQLLGVTIRDDATGDHGYVCGAGHTQPFQHVRHQLGVRAGEDRQADRVHVLGEGGVHDLLGRQPDALVDHLEAGVTGPHGDLLGAVGVPVQARLADQEAQLADAQVLAPSARPCGGPRPGPSPPRRGPPPARTRHPSGARNSPNTSRRAPAHSPVVTPARAHSRVASMRLPVPLAASFSFSSALHGRGWLNGGW